MRSNLCAIVLVCQISCFATQASDSRDAAWGRPVVGCRLGVRADRESYETGQRVILGITLDNSNKHLVYMGRCGILKDYKIDVRLPDGKPAPLTLAGERAAREEPFSASLKRIEAGDSNTVLLVLSDYFDMSLWGEYAVSVQRTFTSEGEKEVSLIQSNDLTVVVNHYTLSPEDRERASGKKEGPR